MESTQWMSSDSKYEPGFYEAATKDMDTFTFSSPPRHEKRAAHKTLKRMGNNKVRHGFPLPDGSPNNDQLRTYYEVEFHDSMSDLWERLRDSPGESSWSRLKYGH